MLPIVILASTTKIQKCFTNYSTGNWYAGRPQPLVIGDMSIRQGHKANVFLKSRFPVNACSFTMTRVIVDMRSRSRSQKPRTNFNFYM